MGVRDLRNRYVRSVLGQFWLMLSSAFMIIALAIFWSLLGGQPLQVLLPFVGIGFVMWSYLSQVITECTSIFITHANLYRNQRMNFSVSIYSVIYRNTIMLAHSLVIVLILIVIFGVPINWFCLQIIPGLLLTWIAMLWVGYVIAMMCVRYRDIIQVITNWLLVLFFITPIMWKRDFLPQEYHFLVDYNPLGQFIELLRSPFLGEPVSGFTWAFTISMAIGGAMLAAPVIGRYHRRVIFWM